MTTKPTATQTLPDTHPADPTETTLTQGEGSADGVAAAAAARYPTEPTKPATTQAPAKAKS